MWSGQPATPPAVSVVVPVFNAEATLGRTLVALAEQDVDVPFEVIVVDDGSSDGSLEVARAAGPHVRVIEGARAGAAEARNRGAAAASAPVIAFTDSDCFPTAGWLRAALSAVRDADLVQGRVDPDPGQPLGHFDRSLWVHEASGFYETANLTVRRELFDGLGGFEGWLRHSGRPFGEDIWLGWRAVRAGARTAFAPKAVVHHAVFDRGARDYVLERLRLEHFPAVTRKVPEFRDRAAFHRLFLSRRTAAFDAAVAGTALALVRRSPIWLIAAAPYVSMLAPRARLARRRAPWVAAVDVTADAVGLAALVRGSVRHRSFLI